MDFDAQKKYVIEELKKAKDHSKKGSIDAEIKPLLNAINRHPDYYTTSSCAGRIVLLARPSRRKDMAEWLFSSHKLVKRKLRKEFFDVIETLRKRQDLSPLWFRQECFILHVVCRNLEVAQQLIDAAKLAGAKHSGIMATKKRIVVEMLSTEHMEVPLAARGKMAVDDSYLTLLLENANQRLFLTRKKMKGLEAFIRKLT